MKEYHRAHKDTHYWMSASEIEAKAKPEPTKATKPTKTSKPHVRNFTMIENGELISVSMLVSNEVVRINGMMV